MTSAPDHRLGQPIPPAPGDSGAGGPPFGPTFSHVPGGRSGWAPDPAPAEIRAAADAVQARVVEHRRRLHRRPELGLVLPATRASVLDEIADLGLAVATSPTTSAVVARLDGARPGPTVILRGDMDALPLTEDTGLDFASQTPGAMHACGHDTHVAMLAGAARVLAGMRERVAGHVLFFFQPGEEGFHGARIALDEGLLEPPPGSAVAGALALHTSSSFETGTVNLRPGPMMASTDALRIVVHGRGGHASAPHATLDPIPVACEIVLALQTALTRRVSAFDPVVLTVAHIEAGTTNNIIPPTARMEGTIRTLSDDVRERVRALTRQVVDGVAAAHGMTADVDLEGGYPVTVNDGGVVDVVRTAASGVLGADMVRTMDNPVLGGEDFSYVLRRYPGALAFLGACPPELTPDEAAPNHSNLVVFDEAAMAAGVSTYVATALRLLAGPVGPVG